MDRYVRKMFRRSIKFMGDRMFQAHSFRRVRIRLENVAVKYRQSYVQVSRVEVATRPVLSQ